MRRALSLGSVVVVYVVIALGLTYYAPNPFSSGPTTNTSGTTDISDFNITICTDHHGPVLPLTHTTVHSPHGLPLAVYYWDDIPSCGQAISFDKTVAIIDLVIWLAFAGFGWSFYGRARGLRTKS